MNQKTVNKKTRKQSEKLLQRREAAVSRGVGQFAGGVTAVSARGARLVDCDGREWVDLAGGIGVLNVGHCDPDVVAAIQHQAAELIHTSIQVATYEPYVALCEKLIERIPHGRATKAVLLNTGAEAVENAVKIARQVTGRSAVICYSDAFHGRTLLGMTLTSKTAYKIGCGPFAPEVYRLRYPYHFRYGAGLGQDEFVAQELARLEHAFVTLVPAEHVAAILIEPVLGEGGFVPAPSAYMQGLRQVCDRHGILLICDEVQSGFGRTGEWSAYQHSGIVPDLSTWAKSMGGGMPIAAVLGKSDIMDAVRPGTIGGTYGGNPVACAAALATIRVFERDHLNARAREIGSVLMERFRSIASKCKQLADVRGLGAMVGVEFCHDRDPSRPAVEFVQAVTQRCLEEQVLVLPAGAYGNVLRILAPLVITDADLKRGLDVLEQAIVESAIDESV